MSIPKAASAQAINVQPFGSHLASARSYALFKAEDMEVIRIVLRASQSLPPHKIPGSVSLHCLEGRLDVLLGDGPRPLQAGELMHLPPNVPHGVRALEDASALVTIALSA
ncbi:cupin domain-containing protein [Comamonas composti]|uniref:cupin domain-containing protein n=1 Tax=Comamonas composti TaxID=408558 RepID=UPI0004065A8F|nr:cupin domain-containing protein [Comamonas composti]